MRNRKFIILVSICLLVFAMGTLYYLNYFYDEEIVTLIPDEGNIKIKPKDPGGMVIPNSDSLVYEKLHASKARKNKIYILPGPEEPMEIGRKAKAKSKFLDSIDEILANIEYYENELEDEESSDNDSMDYIMPNVLLTKDDQEELSENKDKVIFVAGSKLNVIRAIESQYKIIQSNNVVSEEQKGYKIQLASAYSSSDANKQWQTIKHKHSKILQGANLIIKKVEGKNERIFYLVMAGVYPSLSHAKLVCRQLTFRKQNCIVTK